MNTAQTATTKRANGKKAPTKKGANAAQIAKAYCVNPKQLRKALRAKGLRAPYDAAAIDRIDAMAKKMAKAR